MKKFNSLLLLLLIGISSLIFTACLGDDEDDDSCTKELKTARDAYMDKLQSVSTGPTRAQCLELAPLAEKWMVKAQECGDQIMIMEAEAHFNSSKTIQCNAFN
jgi:hypothetical protein